MLRVNDIKLCTLCNSFENTKVIALALTGSGHLWEVLDPSYDILNQCWLDVLFINIIIRTHLQWFNMFKQYFTSKFELGILVIPYCVIEWPCIGLNENKFNSF